MSRSDFGKDPSWFDWDGKRDDMFAKGDWQAELAALHEAIKEGDEESGTAHEAPKAKAEAAL